MSRRAALPRMPPSPGFTLLELLVALVVLGFVMAGLEQGIEFGAVAWRRQDRDIAGVGELDAVDRALRQMVASLEPEGLDDAEAGAEAGTHDPLPAGHALSGSSNAFTFVGNLPEGVAIDRRAIMTVRVDDWHRLVLDWRPEPHLASPKSAAVTTVLLDRVDHIDLAYNSGDTGWQPVWSGPSPPHLIRLAIGFAKGDPRRWAAIVLAPHLDRDDL